MALMARVHSYRSEPILVVSLNEFARGLWQSKQLGLIRWKAVTSILLGFMTMLFFATPLLWGLVVGGFGPRWWLTVLATAVALVMVAGSVFFVVDGVRFLRHPPQMPTVQLTITEDEIIIPPYRRTSLVPWNRPEIRWERARTVAKVIPAKGYLHHELLSLKLIHSSRWTRQWETRTLDTPVQEIIEAISSPRSRATDQRPTAT